VYPIPASLPKNGAAFSMPKSSSRGVKARNSEAQWMRDAYRKVGSLNDLVRLESDIWAGAGNPNP